MPTFGSLFAGIGGIDLGLERAGWECKWQVENDPYATRVLERHWPHVRRWDDVRTFPPHSDSDQLRDEPRRGGGTSRADSTEPEYPGDEWRVELIAAGFPCQDISYAGRGAGLNGERSGLFWEAVRVIRILEPRYVLLENVAALLARGLPEVLGTLASLGFDAEWHCVSAASVGAPHYRDRIFVLGYAQAGNATSVRCEGEDWRSGVGATKRNPETRASVKPPRSSWFTVEPDVGRVADGVPSRVDRLRCLGNAVVPQVAEYIGRQILESLRKD